MVELGTKREFDVERTKVHEHFSKTQDLMIGQLKRRIKAKLSEAIASRGVASMVVSGGSSPIPLFNRLSKEDLPWDKITITLADERWVARDHKDANERMLRETLLVNKAAEAHFVPLTTDAKIPEVGCAEANRRIEAIAKPFDVVMLGMGNDGHTASLFPDGDNLQAALDVEQDTWVMPMRAPGAPQPRITLTLKALLNCRDLVLLCTGQSKQDTFKRAMTGRDIAEMPIRAFLYQQKNALAFYWAP